MDAHSELSTALSLHVHLDGAEERRVQELLERIMSRHDDLAGQSLKLMKPADQARALMKSIWNVGLQNLEAVYGLREEEGE